MKKFFSSLLVSLLFSSKSLLAVNIAGLDRAELIKALYSASRPWGLGILGITNAELPIDIAKSLVGRYIDCLNCRAMKINIPAIGISDEVETFLYNRDNGPNAAERIIEELKKTNINTPALPSSSAADVSAPDPSNAAPLPALPSPS